jgi:glutathione S-transferase
MSKIIIHQIPAGWGLPSIGPFCLKLETYLRMVDLPYETVVDATPFGAPKGKLPWIEHDGHKIGDSGFIIEYLERKFGCDADGSLSDDQRSIARSMRRLLEDNLYWTIVYDRGVPSAARPLIAPVARRGVRKQLAAQGIGRHTREEIHAIGRSDIDALAMFLGDKPFLMGDEPTQLDAVAYGVLANIAVEPIASPVKDELQSRANLVAYLERVRERYFK